MIVKRLSKDATTWLGCGLNPDNAIMVAVKTTPLPLRPRYRFLPIQEYNIGLCKIDVTYFNEFYVEDESDNCRWHIDGYSGTAGNGMQDSGVFYFDGMQFSIIDQDNDLK